MGTDGRRTGGTGMGWDRDGREYFTKAEMLAMQGKPVVLNSGESGVIVGSAQHGEDAYEVLVSLPGNRSYYARKCDHNGVYVVGD